MFGALCKKPFFCMAVLFFQKISWWGSDLKKNETFSLNTQFGLNALFSPSDKHKCICIHTSQKVRVHVLFWMVTQWYTVALWNVMIHIHSFNFCTVYFIKIVLFVFLPVFIFSVFISLYFFFVLLKLADFKGRNDHVLLLESKQWH